MESILDDNPKAVMDPFDDDIQPTQDKWTMLNFTCQTVWKEGEEEKAKAKKVDVKAKVDVQANIPES